MVLTVHALEMTVQALVLTKLTVLVLITVLAHARHSI